MSLNIQERDLVTGELKRTIVAGNSNIVDAAIKTDSTWSSKKINDSLVNIADKLEKNVKFDVDDLNTAYVPNKTITVRTNKNTKNLPPSSMVNFLVTSFAYVEGQYYRITQYCYENSENLSCSMYVRRGVSNAGESSITWSAWRELATTDSTLKTIQLSGSVDCNTLTEPGLYTASSGAVSALTNAPVNNQVHLDGGFSILVTKTNVDSVYYGMQMFIPYGSDLPFIRKSYYLNGQYWTPWEQLATMDKVAHEVDTSYMSNGVLNILAIRQALGVGCYEIMGQGNSGHGSIRLNIWQVSSGAFAFSCCITDFSGVRSICNNEGDSTTVDVGTSYFLTTNRIVKIF